MTRLPVRAVLGAILVLAGASSAGCRSLRTQKNLLETPDEPFYDERDALKFYAQLYHVPSFVDMPVHPWETGDQGVTLERDGHKLFISGRVETLMQKAFAEAVIADMNPETAVFNLLYVGAITLHDPALDDPTLFFNSEHGDLARAAKQVMGRYPPSAESYLHAYEGRLVLVTAVGEGALPTPLLPALHALPGVTGVDVRFIRP